MDADCVVTEGAEHPILGTGRDVLQDACLHAHECVADTFHTHDFLGQFDALLDMTRQRQGQITQADVRLDALGLEVTDRSHGQTVLDGAQGLFNDPQPAVLLEPLTGTAGAIADDNGVQFIRRPASTPAPHCTPRAQKRVTTRLAG